MKWIHFWLGLILYLGIAVAGIGLIVAHQFPEGVQQVMQWGLALSLWAHVLVGVAILLYLAVFLLTGIPWRRREFITFDNENGSVSVSVDAVRKYLDALKSEFAAVVWMKSALRARRGALQVGLVVGVKSGTQIPELCKMLQKRVQEILVEHLGACDLAGVGVEVNEIRGRGAAAGGEFGA